MSLILFRALLTLWSFAPRADRMEDTDETLFVPLRLFAELDREVYQAMTRITKLFLAALVGLSALPFGSCKSEVDKAGEAANETMDKVPRIEKATRAPQAPT